MENKAAAFRWRRRSNQQWEYDTHVSLQDEDIVAEMIGRGWEAEWLYSAPVNYPAIKAQTESLQQEIDSLKEMNQEMVANYRAEIEGLRNMQLMALDTVAQKEDELVRLRDIVDEQKRTIIALNSCIGGEDSTTTDNLIVVTRLQQRVTDLMQMVAILGIQK